MGNSLRDQLLKAGLVDQKRAKQAETERKRKTKEAHRARKSGRTAEPTSEENAARKTRQEREAQAQRSRELNQAREAEKAAEETRKEVRRFVEESAEAHEKGEIRYHFADGTSIERLYVDKVQQAALSKGERAIVKWEGRYRLIPTEVAEKIRARLPETFIHIAEPVQADPDDPYAEYPIPDDLDW